jgi:hypothetical protein
MFTHRGALVHESEHSNSGATSRDFSGTNRERFRLSESGHPVVCQNSADRLSGPPVLCQNTADRLSGPPFVVIENPAQPFMADDGGIHIDQALVHES